MKQFCTTNRRWQTPLSNMWELIVDGKHTGKIYNNLSCEGKSYTWDEINSKFGKEPIACLQ